MTSWLIRTATGDDGPALGRIYREASLSNDEGRANLLAHPEVLDFDDAAVREGRVRVATGPDGVIVGFATPFFRDDIMEIEDLFVDPRWHRHGVASQLVADLFASAAEHGVRRVEVIAQPEALAFYRSAGLVQDGEAPTRFGPAPHLHRNLT